MSLIRVSCTHERVSFSHNTSPSAFDIEIGREAKKRVGPRAGPRLTTNIPRAEPELTINSLRSGVGAYIRP